MDHLRRHLSVANVLSCIALFVALSGAAYAATLANKSVKTKHLANGAVTTTKIRKNAVTKLKIRNGAVSATKIAAGAVGSTQLDDGGVRSIDLGGGVVTTAKLKDNAVTGAKIASEAVSTGQLKEGAVTASKLAPSFVGQLVRNVTYATASSVPDPGTTPKRITALCPPSATQKQAIGGGARIVGDSEDIALIESGPQFEAGKAVGWIAAAREPSGGGSEDWTLEVHAICAEL